MRQKCAKCLEIAALIASHLDRACCGEDVRANTLSRQMTAEMFPLVLAVALGKLFQCETNLCYELCLICHTKLLTTNARAASASILTFYQEHCYYGRAAQLHQSGSLLGVVGISA